MNRVVKSSQGFTLIELVLAMAFISVLLLAIAMTIIQVGTIYNRGMTLKEINQSGRAISDDVKRTANASESIVLANDYVTTTAGGRICFGTYSYIWNTAVALERNDANLVNYESNASKVVRFAKVSDTAKLYCSKNASGGLVYRSIRALDNDKVQELLPPGDHTIGINQFDIPTISLVHDTATTQTLATLQFTLGSGRTSAMNSTQSACLPPTDLNSDLVYCTVQQFTLVLRTGNRVN